MYSVSFFKVALPSPPERVPPATQLPARPGLKHSKNPNLPGPGPPPLSTKTAGKIYLYKRCTNAARGFTHPSNPPLRSRTCMTSPSWDRCRESSIPGRTSMPRTWSRASPGSKAPRGTSTWRSSARRARARSRAEPSRAGQKVGRTERGAAW